MVDILLLLVKFYHSRDDRQCSSSFPIPWQDFFLNISVFLENKGYASLVFIFYEEYRHGKFPAKPEHHGL